MSERTVAALRLVLDRLQVAVVVGLPVLIRGVLQPGGRARAGGGVMGVFGEPQRFLGR
jgi:hypothetical protein